MSGIHLPLQKPTGTMITDANGVDVANILTGTRRTIAEHEELANLFVRAVNSHDALLAACKRLINGKVSWSGTSMHPSGFFCSVCGMNSKMVVHAPGCPILEALNAIDAAEKDVTP